MSQSTVKKIPNNYFDGMPVTGFHKIVFFIIMMAYFCEQMDNWNFGFIAPALMHTWGLQMSDIGVVTLWYFIGMTAGGFFGGVISDFIGRRKTFLISIATFSFFSVLNGFTDNFHVFVIARFSHPDFYRSTTSLFRTLEKLLDTGSCCRLLTMY